jgi:hypothetical protein
LPLAPGRVGPPAVDGIDGGAGRDDVVDAVQHSLVEDDVGRRQLDEPDPRLLGGPGELLDGLELALVGGLREVEALGKPDSTRGRLLAGVLGVNQGRAAAVVRPLDPVQAGSVAPGVMSPCS